MNIFGMTSAPYFLALLISLIGWQVNTISTEIIGAKAVSYRVHIDEKNKVVSAELHNLSRKKTIKNLVFSLRCLSPPCFDAERGRYANLAEFVAHQPVYPGGSLFSIQNALEVRMKTTMPGGSMIEFKAPYVADNPEFQLYYLPPETGDAAGPSDEDIYLFEDGSLISFFLKNYIQIVFWGFVVTGFALLVWILVGIVSAVRGRRKNEKSDNNVHRVILSRERDFRSSLGAGGH